MQLAIAIFTVAAGFAAGALEKGDWQQVYFIGALLPFPLIPILLVVVTMEMRIVRASGWIENDIAPRVAWRTGRDAGKPVLQWESEPDRYLKNSPLERLRPFAGAWTYAAVIGAPGLIGGTVGLVGGIVATSDQAVLLGLSIVGLTTLAGLWSLVAWISQKHEGRH